MGLGSKRWDVSNFLFFLLDQASMWDDSVDDDEAYRIACKPNARAVVASWEDLLRMSSGAHLLQA